jgi:hypothetical protein
MSRKKATTDSASKTVAAYDVVKNFYAEATGISL